MQILRIPKAIHGSMVQHCLDGTPNEACGFLAGSTGVVTQIYLLDNAAASPVYYRPEDRQMLAAMNDIDEKGLDLLGIFHSHVASPPYPSPTDVREAHYPDAVFVIVSLKGDDADVKGFLINKRDWQDADGDIEEVELVVS